MADGRIRLDNEDWSRPSVQERRAIIHAAKDELENLKELLDVLESQHHETLSPARSPSLFAVALAATVAAITIPKVKFTDTRLKNGLRVIVSPDRAAPVVSVGGRLQRRVARTSGTGAPASRTCSSI